MKVNIKHFDANKNNILYINEECPECTPNKICWETMVGHCMKRLLHSEWLLLYLPQQNNRKPNMKHGGFSVLETQISLKKGAAGHHCGLTLKYAVSVKSLFFAFLPTTLILKGSFLRSKHTRVGRLWFLRTCFDVRRRRGASAKLICPLT